MLEPVSFRPELLGEVHAEPDLFYRLIHELERPDPVTALIGRGDLETDAGLVETAEGLLHVGLIAGLCLGFPENIKRAHDNRCEQNARQERE